MEFNQEIKSMNGIRVLLIGETILDKYIYVNPIGTASKDPIISTKFLKQETYLGGIFAPARHLANFTREVGVITVLGSNEKEKNLIQSRIPKTIRSYFFLENNRSTIIKERFVEPIHNRKMFKVEYGDDTPISKETTKRIIHKINEIKDEYDLILVNDFGHGLMNQEIIDFLSKQEKYTGVNVQTNSSNFGFNLANKYHNIDFLTLNERELQLIFQRKDKDNKTLLRELKNKQKFDSILLTLGKDGCLYYNGQFYYSKAFNLNPVDTIGAGDAVFAISSLFDYIKADPATIPILANATGAAAVEIIGNKRAINREDIYKYLREENGMERI